ncbi:MAG: hypothetical protein QXI12_10640 [Candidatus Methanomethyliaceae archaeon]
MRELHEIVEIEDLPQFAGAKVLKAVLSYCPAARGWTEEEIKNLLEKAGLLVPDNAKLIPSGDLERDEDLVDDIYFSVLVIAK